MEKTFIFTALFLLLCIPICSLQAQIETEDYTKIIGSWLRPDGGYVLDIKDVDKEGKIDAAYLNPKSINVSRAGAKISSGKIDVFVELRDKHYPGSYYTLTYNPDTDRLVGVYHHLGIHQNFDVYFIRKK